MTLSVNQKELINELVHEEIAVMKFVLLEDDELSAVDRAEMEEKIEKYNRIIVDL